MKQASTLGKFFTLTCAAALAFTLASCAPEPDESNAGQDDDTTQDTSETTPSDQAPITDDAGADDAGSAGDADDTDGANDKDGVDDAEADNDDADADPLDDKDSEPSGGAREQADSCEWDIDAIANPTPVAVSGKDGELTDVIIGSWQHTHYDSGAGFETIDNDIRYVFPTTSSLIYCQDVPGITDQAENRADFDLDGTEIKLPGAPGYDVIGWSNDAMLWHNNFDDSIYLLQRR